MKCPKCYMALRHLGFDYFGHPVLAKWVMPMDGYLPDHWLKEMCPEAGIIVKKP